VRVLEYISNIAELRESERNRRLKEHIRTNGEILINLAALRFGLKNDTIDRLIEQHQLLWKKTTKKKKAA